MSIELQTTVADIATQFPATIRVFQRHGIDFCCGGKRPLAEACEAGGVSFDVLKQDLESAVAGPAGEQPAAWPEGDLRPLVAHILERYHRPLDEELPRLSQMMQKVLSVHGARHPELEAIAQTLIAICEDLMPHMMKEERVLFPYIERMEALAEAGNSLMHSPFGSIESPIRMMEMEHESVGRLLADLRRDTRGYVPPEDACNTFRGLWHGFAELERETHEHIHIENNILFPRAHALETRLLTAQPAGVGALRRG